MALGLFASAGTAVADAGHVHGSSAEAKADSLHDKTADELFIELEGVVESVTAAVNARELTKLHELTEELSHLATHIAEKVPADKQSRVTGSAKNISSLAASLHGDADKSDQAGVENHLKKLQGIMIVLKGQLK